MTSHKSLSAFQKCDGHIIIHTTIAAVSVLDLRPSAITQYWKQTKQQLDTGCTYALGTDTAIKRS